MLYLYPESNIYEHVFPLKWRYMKCAHMTLQELKRIFMELFMNPLCCLKIKREGSKVSLVIQVSEKNAKIFVTISSEIGERQKSRVAPTHFSNIPLANCSPTPEHG